MSAAPLSAIRKVYGPSVILVDADGNPARYDHDHGQVVGYNVVTTRTVPDKYVDRDFDSYVHGASSCAEAIARADVLRARVPAGESGYAVVDPVYADGCHDPIGRCVASG
jgi:hypothetical protein